MRRTHASLALALALGAVIVFHRSLRQFTLSVVRLPLTAAETLLGVVVSAPQFPRLTQENAALRQALASHQLELIQLRETIRQLTRRQELMRASQDSSQVVATIIGRTLNPTQHAVLLDKGAKHGLSKDSPLVDVAGLVGRVIEVNPTTSFALLLTDPNIRIAGQVERSRELGLVVGGGGRLCQLVYLDLDADVAANDRVLTAGLGGSFPKGLLIGTVVKVIRDEPNAQTSAWIRPAVKISQLEEVLCLLPSS